MKRRPTMSRTMIVSQARQLKKLDDLFDAIRDFPRKKVSVAAAEDGAALAAVKDAAEKDVADYILVGHKEKILKIASELSWKVDEACIVHEKLDVAAARRAVELVSSGEADIFMKGHIHSDDFLRAVLDREVGLRSGSVMSHVFVWDSNLYGRLVFVTDAAMNIAPDLVTKADIILNAVHLANVCGIQVPKVAVLAAVELVNPRMAATVDASSLATMYTRRQFSPRCVVDGPFALDNALSVEAAEVKGIRSPVAGRADILVAPEIEAGNMLAKTYVYLTGGHLAGVVVGAKAPVVLTSRADSARSKLYSLALAVLMSGFERDLKLKMGKVHF